MFQKNTIQPHKFCRRRQIIRVSLLALFFCLSLVPAYAFFGSSNSRDTKVPGTLKDRLTPKPDTTPPTGSISFNKNQRFTNSPQVTLTLSAQDNPGGLGLSQMQFSNNNRTWSAPEPYSTTKAWTLSLRDGPKRVYVKFSDKSGNWSRPYLSSIITLDTHPPKILITSPVNGSVIDDPQVQLKGTIDRRPFLENRSLASGENSLTKTSIDAAGNTASASVKVYYYPGTLIGPEGGVVTSPNGKVKITIPAGALNDAVPISIISLDKNILARFAPEGKTLLCAAEFKPDGLLFNFPIEITFTLDEAMIPGTPIYLGLYEKGGEDKDGKISLSSDPAIVPVDGYHLTFYVQHFSNWSPLAGLISQGAPIGAGVKIPLPDLLTGSFSSSVPITLPPGRKGMQPQLSLNYRSSNSNSWVGLGFSLNPGYIVRSTRLGPPTYDDKKDTFYLITDAGTTELVNLIDNLYQAKVESSFTKFFKEADDSWRALSKDGATLRFGQSSDSKETSSSGTFSWFLTKAVDTNGNYISYSYTKDQGKSYLSHIDYTGNENGASPANSVEFSTESRTDVFSSYISNSRIVTAKRLKEIQAKAGDDLVWSYELIYDYSPDTNRSTIKSITQYTSDDKNLPTQTFTYQQAK
ncbi:MAG: SpvB/TcaC N-terminal domain-containing protein [Candidatus Omnitrophota bacterium]|nr:SpvB/TcaC N-terminal domain-containing protein [Candidatus Omnitrophota bacterium]